MARWMRSQESSPINHGLSKSLGVRKRRFGGILRRCLARTQSDIGNTMHKRVRLNLREVDADDLDRF